MISFFEVQEWYLTEDMKLGNLDAYDDWKYGETIWSIAEGEEEDYLMVKGQLISKYLFGVIVSTKIATKIL